MKSFILIFLTVFLMLVLSTACKETTSNNNSPPPQVVLMEKSPDSVAVETGIDAEDPTDRSDPNKNGILIQWYPVDHENLYAYDIYRRAKDTTGKFQKIGEVIQPFGVKDTVYLDLEVGLDTIYYYYVVARDEDGLEGEPSNKDHYTLVHKPSLSSPINNQLFNGTFEWSFSGFGAQYFIFRMERKGVDNKFLPYFLKLHELTYYGQQVWNLAEIGLDTLSPGEEYRWRIDVRILRDDRKGSESDWELFRVE